MHLAWRNLWQNRTKFALTVMAVSLAITLVLLLNGLLQGIYRQVAQYPEHAPGELVILQEGVTNLLAATSLLPPGAAEEVRRVDGVEEVVPVLAQFVILELHERKQPVYLVGYEPSYGAGPWNISGGRELEADNDIVVDRVLAQRHGLRLGDSIEVQGSEFTVAGFSSGTSTTIGSYVFVSKSSAERLLGLSGSSSHLFVTPSRGTAADELVTRLDGLPGMTALTKRRLIENDQAFVGDVFSTPLRLMVGIALTVGTLVVGLVIYTATVERRREYGVLKAIGAGNGRLYAIVAAQAAMAASAGAVAGVVIAFGAAALIEWSRPQFLVLVEPGGLTQIVLASVLIALLAALAPVRLVARLAPADVFRN